MLGCHDCLLLSTAVAATSHFRDIRFSGLVPPPAGGISPPHPGGIQDRSTLWSSSLLWLGVGSWLWGAWDSTTDMISL